MNLNLELPPEPRFMVSEPTRADQRAFEILMLARNQWYNGLNEDDQMWVQLLVDRQPVVYQQIHAWKTIAGEGNDPEAYDNLYMAIIVFGQLFWATDIDLIEHTLTAENNGHIYRRRFLRNLTDSLNYLVSRVDEMPWLSITEDALVKWQQIHAEAVDGNLSLLLPLMTDKEFREWRRPQKEKFLDELAEAFDKQVSEALRR